MQAIIQALKSNTCPKCNHHIMAAKYRGGKHFVTCFFCESSWEVGPDQVSKCDMLNFKKGHGHVYEQA